MRIWQKESELWWRERYSAHWIDNKELFIAIILVNFGTVEMLLVETTKQKKIPFVRIFKEYAFRYLALQFSKKFSGELNNIRLQGYKFP